MTKKETMEFERSIDDKEKFREKKTSTLIKMTGSTYIKSYAKITG